MNYCKDCKWVRISFFERLLCGWEFAKCAAPQAKRGPVDLVCPPKGDGECIHCLVHRTDSVFDLDGYCGKEAKFFEPKDKNAD